MIKIFSSMGWALFFMLIFAISIAVATFIEQNINTTAAWLYVYGSHWLEIIMVLLIVVLIINLFKFKLFRLAKLPSLAFHFSFILIAFGALITRYFGFEGSLHLRINETNDSIFLEKYYLKICDLAGNCKKDMVNEYDNSSFFIKMQLDKGKVHFKIKKYAKSLESVFIPNAENIDAKDTFSFSISNGINVAPLELFENESVDIDGVLLKFDKSQNCSYVPDNSVCFGFEDGGAFVRSSLELSLLNSTTIAPNIKTRLKTGELYRAGGLTFVPKQALQKAVKSWRQTQANGERDGFLLEIKAPNNTQNVWIVADDETEIFIDDYKFKLRAFKQSFKLPFSVRLDEFSIQRYAGSNSPSSYFSKVGIAQNDKADLSATISPNSPLDYDGYRLFQTSYDKDELGSLLSVSFDPGRRLTYAGYTLLCLGLLLNLFNKSSRFQSLLRNGLNN